MTIFRGKRDTALAIGDKIDTATLMAHIIDQLNAIGDNPLYRGEVDRLRRAYAAAAVRYFDQRQVTEVEGPC